MKDKRQRLALAWPYADPALAAYILHAAAASANYPYAPAAAASLYQAAYYPHPAAAAAAAAAAANMPSSGSPSGRAFQSSQSASGAQQQSGQQSGVPTQPPQHQSPAPGPMRGFHSPSHFSPIAAAAAAAAAAGGVPTRTPQNFPFPYLGRSPNLNLPGHAANAPGVSPLGHMGVAAGLLDDLNSNTIGGANGSRLSVPIPMSSTSPTSSSSNTSDNCHNCISVDGHSPNGLHSPGFHHHFHHHLNSSLNSNGSVKSASPSPVSSSSPIGSNTMNTPPTLFQPYKESGKA